MEQYPGGLSARYEARREEIGGIFFNGRNLGAIASVSAVGDRHQHGEAALRVETETGDTLYYKPRDGAGADFLAELNTALFGERMTPEQISGNGYVFQKPIEERIPEAGEERAAYYTRLGRLTAVFYALGSIDMHGGNVLPAGAFPVAVDTESLLCAYAEGAGGTGEFSVDYGEVFPDYRASVGECMVLPRFFALRQNSPLLPDGCTVEGYEVRFLAGFEDGYRRVVKRRAFLFDLLNRYAAMPVRYILRSTRSYYGILAALAAAKDEAERETSLGRLLKGLSAADCAYWAPVLKWERACLLEGDIPYFWSRAGERTLRGDMEGEPLIRGFFKTSPAESAKQRAMRMDEHDLAVQTAYIRANLRHIDGWENRIAKYLKPTPKEPDELPAPLPPEEALTEASKALQQLWEERIPLSGGRVLWHAPLVSGKVGSLFGLAEGFSGIAVFCEAMASTPLAHGAEGIAKELAAACFADLSTFGQYLLGAYRVPPDERTLARRFIGGFDFIDGLAGYLWALKRCRSEEPHVADHILHGFRSWPIPDRYGEELAALERERPWSGTDTLENGASRRAALYLLLHEKGGAADIEQAGRLLAWILGRKWERGVYTVFPVGRKQYFLPAFLRGSLGVAYVMLRYAELCEKRTAAGPQEVESL